MLPMKGSLQTHQLKLGNDSPSFVKPLINNKLFEKTKELKCMLQKWKFLFLILHALSLECEDKSLWGYISVTAVENLISVSI